MASSSARDHAMNPPPPPADEHELSTANGNSPNTHLTEIRHLAQHHQRVLDSKIERLQGSLTTSTTPSSSSLTEAQRRRLQEQKRVAKLWGLPVDELQDFFGPDVSWRFYKEIFDRIVSPHDSITPRLSWDAAQPLLIAARRARMGRPDKRHPGVVGEAAEEEEPREPEPEQGPRDEEDKEQGDVELGARAPKNNAGDTDMPRISRSKMWTPDDVKRALAIPTPSPAEHESNVTARSSARQTRGRAAQDQQPDPRAIRVTGEPAASEDPATACPPGQMALSLPFDAHKQEEQGEDKYEYGQIGQGDEGEHGVLYADDGPPEYFDSSPDGSPAPPLDLDDGDRAIVPTSPDHGERRNDTPRQAAGPLDTIFEVSEVTTPEVKPEPKPDHDFGSAAISINPDRNTAPDNHVVVHHDSEIEPEMGRSHHHGPHSSLLDGEDSLLLSAPEDLSSMSPLAHTTPGSPVHPDAKKRSCEPMDPSTPANRKRARFEGAFEQISHDKNGTKVKKGDCEGHNEANKPSMTEDSSTVPEEGDSLLLGPHSAQSRPLYETIDLSSLRNERWVEGRVINAALDCLLRAASDEADMVDSVLLDPSASALPSTASTCARLTSSQSPNIYLPLNLGGTHWALAIVRRQRREIRIFDSLPSPSGHRLMEEQLAYFVGRFLPGEDWVSWRLLYQSTPRQTNTDDCGVLVLICALHHATGSPLPSVVDATLWRSLLAYLLSPLMDYERRVLQDLAEQEPREMIAAAARLTGDKTDLDAPDSSGRFHGHQHATIFNDETGSDHVLDMPQHQRADSSISQLCQAALSSARSLLAAAASTHSALEHLRTLRNSLCAVTTVTDAMQSLTTKTLCSVAASGGPLLSDSIVHHELVATAEQRLSKERVDNAGTLLALREACNRVEKSRVQWVGRLVSAATARTRWMRASRWARGEALCGWDGAAARKTHDSHGKDGETAASPSLPNHSSILAALPPPVGTLQLDQEIVDLTVRKADLERGLEELREMVKETKAVSLSLGR